jgi:hypothetical protein
MILMKWQIQWNLYPSFLKWPWKKYDKYGKATDMRKFWRCQVYSNHNELIFRRKWCVREQWIEVSLYLGIRSLFQRGSLWIDICKWVFCSIFWGIHAVKICSGKWHSGDWCLHHNSAQAQNGTDVRLILKWYCMK